MNFKQWFEANNAGVSPVGIWTTPQVVSALEVAYNAGFDSAEAKPQIVCSKCGVDRLLEPCPTNLVACRTK